MLWGAPVQDYFNLSITPDTGVRLMYWRNDTNASRVEAENADVELVVIVQHGEPTEKWNGDIWWAKQYWKSVYAAATLQLGERLSHKVLVVAPRLLASIAESGAISRLKPLGKKIGGDPK